MTRVSDRAAFADAVSRAGALPFLALSLMRGQVARSLLAETKELLGGRAWGVGILGFVPAEIRDEQLALLIEAKPPVALIAGGRPSQARTLEAQGTSAYLHVPSPGLLDMFLQDGARRFVFEGRECGGHVGPRTSFVLWEAQIERLLAFERPGDLSVLFAGGIHDARSAAMVAAMAAPLAAAGAKVGVLMGTAYLFTREAVETGAIQPGFQQAALGCERTVLLETAPGHATRCVDTQYVRSFGEERQRLRERGIPAKQAWETLEQLNLGRLRIAAKGIRRDGDRLLPVDAEAQKREGMYMIGQVAALREGTSTVAELHADVSEGGTALLAALERGASAGPTRVEVVGSDADRPADVAVIGMACVMPGAPDLATFWSHVVAGADSITEVPVGRWSQDIYYDKAAPAGTGKTVSKWGGFIPPIAFDPLVFGIPPRSLAAIEPVQLLALEVARRALADAGYAERVFDRERTSVIFGAEAGTDLSNAYAFRALYPQFVGDIPAELDGHLPKLSEDSFPGVLANVIAGRIANRLDLGGVNYTVDAACAASLAAIDLAVKELRARSSHMVLCGAADLHNTINDYLLFSSVHALSPSGRCRTFDAEADGIVLGEGVACVVLKRLHDAEQDGDRVYAVIKGVAGSSDGRSLGLTAPRKEGQVRALDRAYRMAGLSPAEVGLVEAHGTGTVVGDRTELATLTEIFGRAGASPGSCALGSVKSQIGHTKCAAGLAGLIKAALAIHRRVLPPTLHVKRPNPFHDSAVSPFALSGAARPWPAARRMAGVSAFGFGGTNFHVVLSSQEGAETPEHGVDLWPAELFLFRGNDRAAAAATVAELERTLNAGDAWQLADLARTVSTLGEGPVQVAVVATDLADLRAKLPGARTFTRDPRGVIVRRIEPGKVAFLFPGQGSQRPGMLADLFVAFPRLQRFLELGAGWVPPSVLLPPTAPSPEVRAAQSAALTDTRVAQPALGIAGLAVAELLGELGVEPDMVGGHSYGELVALSVAGAFDERDLLSLSAARGECILAAAGDDPGAMAAVNAGAAAIEAALGADGGVVLANLNAPDQTVVAGTTAAVEAALPRLEAAGLTARRIPVACAFHSPVVAGAAATFRARLDAVAIRAPALPVWSNTSARAYPNDPDAVRDHLAAHLARPVRFAEQIEAMYASGARLFVEAGPGHVLSGLVEKVLGARPHVTVPCDRSGEAGLRQLLFALGELAVHGAPLLTERLWEGRGANLVDLTQPSALRPPPSAWMVDGQMARPLSGEVPPGAMHPITHPLGTGAPAGGSAVSERDAAVVDYLRTMREMVDAQRQVMLRFLGSLPEEAGRTPRLGAAAPARSLAAQPEVSPRRPDRTQEPPATAAQPAPAVGTVEALLAIVSERTGYPVEMLGLDLDLEAELSIDSIKRVEILGALTSRLGLSGQGIENRDAVIETLATVKTLRGIVDWLANRAPTSGTSAARHPPQNAASRTEPSPAAVSRYVFSVQEAPPVVADASLLAGRRFLVTPDGGGSVAPRLAALLEAAGATARILAPGETAAGADGLIFLGSLPPDPSRLTAKCLFELCRQALLAGATTILAATGMGGGFGRRMNGTLPAPGGGISGLIKTVAQEWPEVRTRVVDLDPHEDAEALARHLLDELQTTDRFPEVGYSGGTRHVLTAIPNEVIVASTGPALLDRDSVVLVTGGARGITAQISIALAQRFGCRLELVGRSALPDASAAGPDDDPEVAAAPDLPALRRVLAARGAGRSPGEIEASCGRILAARSIRATQAAIHAAGGSAVYHSVDVRDRGAFGALIDDVYKRHGRLDGVVHGAGVLEDKLLRHKSGESFDRVFDTKVQGALALAEKLRPDVRFVAFFSSVSGAFGNRGQVDYAAANDAVDKIALALNERLPGRVVSINWGPWSGPGMVTPELELEYSRRGIGLVPAPEGVARFLDEITGGALDAQVLLAGAGVAPATLRS